MVASVDRRADFFSKRLRECLGTNIRQVILFGSRARGDAHEGSDYDFIVILEHTDNNVVDTIRQIEVEFLDKYDTLSASVILDEAEWNNHKNLPIGINVAREGIFV